mmetsp:Transcript_60441/g.143004  ORF Transcript_60441/g.143004 Transcript_60441/m.143004 type:complete len:97 (-) Transcript_60441:201-491(-)
MISFSFYQTLGLIMSSLSCDSPALCSVQRLRPPLAQQGSVVGVVSPQILSGVGNIALGYVVLIDILQCRSRCSEAHTHPWKDLPFLLDNDLECIHG